MNKDYHFQAICKQIEIGGKFWCWHDWIYNGIYFPQSAWEYAKGYDASFLCVNCGKGKIGYMGAELTRYDSKGHKILF